MNRDAKSVKSNWNREISFIEGWILDSHGRGFDGNGYPFKTAVRNLRRKGHKIKYSRTKCNYTLIQQ